jgi:hypothetical protein
MLFRTHPLLRALCLLLLGSLSTVFPARANPVAVLTQHNDNARTGMNLQETILNTTNVSTNSFGLLYTRPVDDQIYAQPLIATNVTVPAHGTHNLVIVCTVNDTVYAYDAEDPTVTAPYWTNSFINPPNIIAPRNTDMTGACGGAYKDFSGAFGIVGAPVIDPTTSTLYVVVRTKENGVNYLQRLHALDLTTGLDRPNSPVVVAATNSGVIFDPYKQNQRPGLLLANGYVYITWSSHCDWQPYHGWVIGYNTSNLLQGPVSFNANPSGSEAGIWMSNQGPAADANGNIYISTGNGTFDGVSNFGQSFIKLTQSGTSLTRASWFTPYNWNTLNGMDNDLGSGGLLLIPGTSLLFSGGKGGGLYLVNRDNMGGVGASADTNIIQSWNVGSHQIHGGAVWWDSPGGSYAYIWPATSDHLRQYSFDRVAGKFASTNVYSQGAGIGGTGQPGGILALSANGANAGSGIVWAAVNTFSSANQAVVPGTLHAYNAANVASELWNSDMLSLRDSLGNFAKFVAPTVANGKVYMATFSNRLNVYGLLPQPTLSVSSAANGNLIVSWLTNSFPGFHLQTTLSTSTPWSNDSHSVMITNGIAQVTIPASNAETFYRLIR